jgi:hypothetical protein
MQIAHKYEQNGKTIIEIEVVDHTTDIKNICRLEAKGYYDGDESRPYDLFNEEFDLMQVRTDTEHLEIGHLDHAKKDAHLVVMKKDESAAPLKSLFIETSHCAVLEIKEPVESINLWASAFREVHLTGNLPEHVGVYYSGGDGQMQIYSESSPEVLEEAEKNLRLQGQIKASVVEFKNYRDMPRVA